jgi:hypothetical protein
LAVRVQRQELGASGVTGLGGWEGVRGEEWTVRYNK